jgi:hypothetical protein
MNQVLPLFYQSMYRFCPNSRTFVSQFHAEGQRQYDLHSRICKLEDRISKILSTVNTAAAGKYLDQDYIMTPSDMIVLKNNLREIDNLKESLEKEIKMIREQFTRYFSTKTGKIKDGHHQCSKAFDEEKISKLLKIQEKVNETGNILNDKLKQCSDMFKGNPVSRNKRRAKKENRQKAKKRKATRTLKNMEKVRLLISNTVAPMVIDSHNLHLEMLLTLSNKQVKYVRMLYNERMLSEKAVLTIEEFIKTSIKSSDQTSISSDDDDLLRECDSDADDDADNDHDNDDKHDKVDDDDVTHYTG